MMDLPASGGVRADTSSFAHERDELAAAYKNLSRAGVLPGSSGNMSVRIPGGLLITATGADGRTITSRATAAISFDGAGQDDAIPSSEWAMHRAVYLARSEANAVVHGHGDASVALACTRKALPPFHYMVASFGGDDVRCSGYAPFGSEELADAAIAALEDRTACLLANHGMLCFGPDLLTAMSIAMKLETLARQYLLACQAGTPIHLSAAEMAEARRRYRYYGRGRIPT